MGVYGVAEGEHLGGATEDGGVRDGYPVASTGVFRIDGIAALKVGRT